MGMAPNLSQLREMSEADILARYDAAAQSTVVGTQFYLDELNRRTADRQTDALLRYTRTLARLTWVLVVLTIVIAVSVIPGIDAALKFLGVYK